MYVFIGYLFIPYAWGACWPVVSCRWPLVFLSKFIILVFFDVLVPFGRNIIVYIGIFAKICIFCPKWPLVISRWPPRWPLINTKICKNLRTDIGYPMTIFFFAKSLKLMLHMAIYERGAKIACFDHKMTGSDHCKSLFEWRHLIYEVPVTPRTR